MYNLYVIIYIIEDECLFLLSRWNNILSIYCFLLTTSGNRGPYKYPITSACLYTRNNNSCTLDIVCLYIGLR